MASPKRMNFSEKFQSEGGHLNPKIHIADFGPLNRDFEHEILKSAI